MLATDGGLLGSQEEMDINKGKGQVWSMHGFACSSLSATLHIVNAKLRPGDLAAEIPHPSNQPRCLNESPISRAEL
jgi:hypothetical protein